MSTLPAPPERPRTVPLRRAWGYAWSGIIVCGVLAVVTLGLGLLLLQGLGGVDPLGTDDGRLDQGTRLAAGRIVAVENTGVRSGRSYVVRYRYEYVVAEGPRLNGWSFAWVRGRPLRPGAKVAVEYLPDDHRVSRIVDTRLSIGPAWLWPLLVVLFGAFGLGAGLFLLRAMRRRAVAENGQAVEGRITAVARRPWINPTPAILTYEFEDPTTGQQVQATHWLRDRKVDLARSQLPAPCWVAVADDMSGRSVVLAFDGWRAWDNGTAALS